MSVNLLCNYVCQYLFVLFVACLTVFVNCLVSVWSKVRPITFGCVVQYCFIFRSRLLLYSAGYGVNRVEVVLSRFSVRLFCLVQATTLCIYWLHSCLCV